MTDTRLCEVPGCNQTIRLVKLGDRWIAVNVAPARPGTIEAHGATIFVSGKHDAVEAPPEKRVAVLARGDNLYVKHDVTCADPNWRRVNKAVVDRRPAEDR